MRHLGVSDEGLALILDVEADVRRDHGDELGDGILGGLLDRGLRAALQRRLGAVDDLVEDVELAREVVVDVGHRRVGRTADLAHTRAVIAAFPEQLQRGGADRDGVVANGALLAQRRRLARHQPRTSPLSRSCSRAVILSATRSTRSGCSTLQASQKRRIPVSSEISISRSAATSGVPMTA